MKLVPSFPYVWLVADRCFLAISDNWLHKQMLIFEELLFFIFVSCVLQQRKCIFVLCVLVDQLVDSTNRLLHGVELALAEPLLLQVDELKLDPALLKESLCFSCIGTLLRAKYLNIHNYYLCFLYFTYCGVTAPTIFFLYIYHLDKKTVLFFSLVNN